MYYYDLTIENGVITYIDDTDEAGCPLPGILYIPKNATSFSPDAWVSLGCKADGILVHPDNPVFSSAHNCLLSKDGTTLIKTCKNSRISKLSGLKTIGPNAFQTVGADAEEEFNLRIPSGVQVLDYRALAVCAETVRIIVPSSVIFIDLLAFMIHSDYTHIAFEGDADLRIGTFGTAAEAEDSGYELYRSMPSVLYPKADRISVSCPRGSKISAYCKKYGIPEV
jgi:hypothetical protein